MSRTTDNNPLDRAIDLVAGDCPNPQLVEQAAARVWERLSQQSEHPAAAPAAASQPASHPAPGASLQRCEDFQGLIPAYLRGELSPARALLLEDHTRSCVPCRRALREAREGHATAVPAGAAARSSLIPNASGFDFRAATGAAGRRRAVWLSLAAVLVAALGAGLFLFTGPGLPSGARMAQVQSIEGRLFRVSGPSSVAVGAGDAVTQGEVIRTAKGSRALVRMNDGSLIEMSERAALALRVGRGGNTIALERGRIIVQAAKQRPRHLFVSTGDCLVSVTGTVFAVNHGTKGSRVSVIEGEVHVQQARQDSTLHPGEQVTTHSSVAAVPVRQEIAWSRDAAHYQTMLAALAGASRAIDQQIAPAGLRSSTRLLDLAPASTGAYIALPNLAGSLAETHRLLEQRLAQNEELKQWWSGSFGTAADEARYQTLMQEIGDLGHYLGDEIVFAMPLGGGSADAPGLHPEEPVLLATVTNEAGFRATLAQEIDKVNARAGRQVLVLVGDRPAPTAAGGQQVLLWVGNGVFVATRTAAALAEVAGYAAGTANPFVASAFRARIADAYNDGAGWLFASDLGKMVSSQRQESLGENRKTFETLGIYDLEHFILNYREAATGGEARAAVTFGRPRRGVASWLAAPAPMGSLDFFSADANLVVAFVVKSPVALLDELLSASPQFATELAKAEAEYHFDLRTDLAQPLGGEVAFGLDGPLLPKPSWKLVAEVYDPVKLQQTFERAVAQINTSLQAAGKPGITLGQEQSGALTYYTLAGGGAPAASGGTEPAIEIHYVFADGYVIAAPSRALLDQALSLKSSGVSLASAKKFHDLLGQDGQVNVSALFYRDLGSLSSVAGAVPAMVSAMAGPAATARGPHGHMPFGAQAGGPFGAMLGSSGPSLFYAYAEDSRILFGGKSQPGPLGVNLQALAGFRVLLAGLQREHGEAAEAAEEAAR